MKVWNYFRYLILLGISIALNYLFMAAASPNYYATMSFDTPLKTVITIAKVLFVVIILGFIIPKSKKTKTK